MNKKKALVAAAAVMSSLALVSCGISETQVTQAYNATIPDYNKDGAVLMENSAQGMYDVTYGYKDISPDELMKWLKDAEILPAGAVLKEKQLLVTTPGTVTAQGRNFDILDMRCFASDRGSDYKVSDMLLVAVARPESEGADGVQSALGLYTEQNGYGCADEERKRLQPQIDSAEMFNGAVNGVKGLFGGIAEGFVNGIGESFAESIFGN